MGQLLPSLIGDMRLCAASCSLRACDSTSPPVSEEQTLIRRLTAIRAVIFLRNLRFIMGDMLDLPFDGRSDMVSSNTGLHWVSDHGRAFSGIARALRPGGRALLQMGGRGNAAPILELADEMLAEEPWTTFSSIRPSRYAFYGPDEEHELLEAAGLTPVRVELIGKDMAFDNPDGLAGWIRTTWHLYLDRLPEEVRPAFIAGLTARYVERSPSQDGRIHVLMVRLEVEAVKKVE